LLIAVAAFFCLAARLPDHVLVAYHDSWNELPVATAEQTTLAALPAYLDIVFLAFAKPDAIYRGDLDITRTGLEYRISGGVLRDAVALLKRRHPGTRVLLSVGGSTYKNWNELALPEILAFVRDFNLDGIDIDFEPADPQCSQGMDGRVACATDEAWRVIIGRSRIALPRPYLLTASVWSVGAYGEGDFGASRPPSDYTGIMLPLMRSMRAADIDLISINAYDAGSEYDPLEALRAYRTVWRGRLAIGVEVRYAGGAGPFYSTREAAALAREVVRDPRGGMMLYPLLARPEGGPADSPTGTALARALCQGMGQRTCAAGD
jgi:hypothetical protein